MALLHSTRNETRSTVDVVACFDWYASSFFFLLLNGNRQGSPFLGFYSCYHVYQLSCFFSVIFVHDSFLISLLINHEDLSVFLGQIKIFGLSLELQRLEKKFVCVRVFLSVGVLLFCKKSYSYASLLFLLP